MTSDQALVAHLSMMFANPHTADIRDVVVSDDDSVWYVAGDFAAPERVDDETYIESVALRSLDFLGSDVCAIIRQRWLDEGYWENWCGEDAEGDDD